MLYLKEALVYLAVLIAVTSSQATYGRRRSPKYLPPKRSYKPVKKVVKTYNPVKEVVKTYNPVVKKAIHPKHASKFPVVDPLGPILPDERPVGGGFFPDPLAGGIDRIGDQRRPVRGGDIPWGPSGDFNPRMSRGNDRRDGAGLIPFDPLDRRGSDPWVDRSRSRSQLPSSIDRVGDPWVDRNGGDASRWTDINGPRSPISRNEGRLPGFIADSRLRDWNPRDERVGGIVDRGVGGSIGDILPNENRNPSLRDLNPGMTRLLRNRLRDTVSNARTNTGFRNRERLPGGRREEFLPNLRERQNW